MAQPTRIRASHILVRTKHMIDYIYDLLMNGESFEKLAENYSICPSAKQGGDLGFFSRGETIPEFEDVAFSMKVGEISKPIKTEFGYHIIKITAKE